MEGTARRGHGHERCAGQSLMWVAVFVNCLYGLSHELNSGADIVYRCMLQRCIDCLRHACSTRPGQCMRLDAGTWQCAAMIISTRPRGNWQLVVGARCSTLHVPHENVNIMHATLHAPVALRLRGSGEPGPRLVSVHVTPHTAPIHQCFPIPFCGRLVQ